ncbi:MAG TPA: divalent-cation tolerance protein CutA [Candidatus Nanoarchaeia archaeon]|nr:divalent-cation tolerance protein CutA [Candidatus Nanoarchaeia archaeon]
MIRVHITCKDEEEAKSVSEHLLKKRLIACSNMHPISSMYWWKGKIEKRTEFVIDAKAPSANWDKIQNEVRNVHSYEVPCIIRIEASANKECEEWIEGESR